MLIYLSMYMYITIITTFLYIPRFRFFISKYFHSLSCLYLQRLSISTVCVLNHSSSYDYPNYTPVLYILVKQCQCCLYLTLILLLLIKCKGTEEERARVPFAVIFICPFMWMKMWTERMINYTSTYDINWTVNCRPPYNDSNNNTM